MKTNEERIKNLEEIITLQQRAIKMLGDALRGHQRILEALQPKAAEPQPTQPLTVN